MSKNRTKTMVKALLGGIAFLVVSSLTFLVSGEITNSIIAGLLTWIIIELAIIEMSLTRQPK